MGTFGQVKIEVPRARLDTPDGKTTEWKSQALRAYRRRTQAADALIAGCYLSGTNTRRVRRALRALFGGAVGKDVVSRVWRKVKSDWEAWNARSLVTEPIVRLILDGTVVRVRLDREATSISLFVVMGVRADGQKVLWRSRAWAARAPRQGTKSREDTLGRPCRALSYGDLSGEWLVAIAGMRSRRHNWTFAGSDEGGPLPRRCYLHTDRDCKALNDIDPEHGLRICSPDYPTTPTGGSAISCLWNRAPPLQARKR